MEAFQMEIAGVAFQVMPLHMSTRDYCRAYWTKREAEVTVCVTEADLVREQELLDLEAVEEGLKKRKFGGPFLERSMIQRRVAEALLERDVVMMHGSTVAVDGQAYLFTAACGTGKSTHTRFWREVFGARAVMVNDDKPFLRVCADRVLAYGSPWTGKHGLGENVCVPLKGICILERGAVNVILSADAEDCMEMLRHQAFTPENPALIEHSLDLVERIAAIVPNWKMKCTKDPEAARVSYAAMSR